MIPGEIIAASGEIELNAGQPTVTIEVSNTGDRPVQVGSHYHFAETNAGLSFDHDTVRGMRVLDFAAGSGLVGIAAAKAGAAAVTCADIDPFCRAAVSFNAAANGVAVGFAADDLVGTDGGWDVVLAGDVFYEKPFADRLVPWLSALAARGARVLVGDPGRAYLPKEGLERRAVYEVPVTRALEDAEVKRTTVWELT